MSFTRVAIDPEGLPLYDKRGKPILRRDRTPVCLFEGQVVSKSGVPIRTQTRESLRRLRRMPDGPETRETIAAKEKTYREAVENRPSGRPQVFRYTA